MDTPYTDTTDENDEKLPLEAFDTKFDLTKHVVEKFIIEKITQEEEFDIEDDITLVNFGENPTEPTYLDELFKKEIIEKFPEEPLEEPTGDLPKALKIVED